MNDKHQTAVQANHVTLRSSLKKQSQETNSAFLHGVINRPQSITINKYKTG